VEQQHEHGNDVDCVVARECVSAMADDELGAHDSQRLEHHLSTCGECTAYAASVASMARSTRLRTAHVDPVFVETVMARSRPARLGRGGWMRPALAWIAVLTVAQSVSPLVFGEIDGTPTHVARHVGASTLALGIGLLYAAWRPHRAFGLLPFVAALFGAMIVAALFDMLSGDRSPVSELAHATEMVGMVLLWMIAGSPGWDRVIHLPRPGRAVAR
jgi:predicted anti-sigma-YlaC factor YlaD